MRSAIALALLLAVVAVVSGCTSNEPEPTGQIVKNENPQSSQCNPGWLTISVFRQLDPERIPAR